MGSIDGWRHPESGVDAAVVVIADVPVDRLDHLAGRRELVKIAEGLSRTDIQLILIMAPIP